MLYSWIFQQLMLIGILHAGDAIFCGTPVPFSERSRFNYLVEIVHYNEKEVVYCAGAIIDATHILTAAHCVVDPSDAKTVILAGVVHLDSILTISQVVSKIHIHGEYKDFEEGCRRWGRFGKWIGTVFQCIKEESEENCEVENDIAVLTLFEALPLGEYTNVVNLPDTDFLPRCQLFDYAGWGQTKKDGEMSLQLFSTQMMILTAQDCRSLKARFSHNEFCAMDPIEYACPLEGDSGAPLVFNNTVYGVSSTGEKDPTYPNIFSKVFDHLDFIRKALEN